MTEVARVSRSSDSVSSCIDSRNCTSRPENGSSISITAGRGTMARASATRCCWPPERMCGYSSARLASPTRFSAASASRARLRLGQRLEAEGDVAEDGQVREQREVLEHQADAAILRSDEARRPRHLEPVDQHAAAGRLLDAGGDAQQRRLPATRRPEQANDLGRRDVEVDAGQRLRLIVVAGDVLEGELRGERAPRRDPCRSRWHCRSVGSRRAVSGSDNEDN